MICGFLLIALVLFKGPKRDDTMIRMQGDSLKAYADSFNVAKKIVELADEKLKKDSIQHVIDSVASLVAMQNFIFSLNNRKAIVPKHDKAQSAIMQLDADSSIRRVSALAHAIDSLRQRIRKNQ